MQLEPIYAYSKLYVPPSLTYCMAFSLGVVLLA